MRTYPKHHLVIKGKSKLFNNTHVFDQSFGETLPCQWMVVEFWLIHFWNSPLTRVLVLGIWGCGWSLSLWILYQPTEQVFAKIISSKTLSVVEQFYLWCLLPTHLKTFIRDHLVNNSLAKWLAHAVVIELPVPVLLLVLCCDWSNCGQDRWSVIW